MRAVYFAAARRTPIGKLRGGLSHIRPDDLAAAVIRTLVEGIDPARVDEVYWGAANQAGEDNRNVARMAVLLAGLPETVPGATVNRLCASGMEAVTVAARTIAAGEADVVVESVGGTLWSDVLKVLAPGGRLVTCGVTADSHAHLHLGRLMVKGWTLRGIGRPGPEAVARQLREALALSAVTAAPAIAATYRLERAAAAHEQLEASDFVGRIVLTTG